MAGQMLHELPIISSGFFMYNRTGNEFGGVRRGEDGDSPRALGLEGMEDQKVKHPQS